MGQLDDAIREHLDLKRRRGADPDEVAAQERDALEPVHRESEPESDLAPDPPEAPALGEQPTSRAAGEPHDQM